MIRSHIDLTDRMGEITIELERRTVVALNEAAIEAARVADAAANTPKPIAHFAAVPAVNVGDGYASAVRTTPLTRIFDHGSLGKRNARLKEDRREPEWEVKRGSNPYTAHRGDIEGKGIAPRNILNAARRAGRRILIDRLARP